MIRTCDTWFRKPVLYPLSYEGGMRPEDSDGAAEAGSPLLSHPWPRQIRCRRTPRDRRRSPRRCSTSPRRGYTDSFALAAEGLSGSDAQLHALESAAVDYRFRFEGESDPGDEAIVLGITCAGRHRGVLVSGFGPSADPAHVAVLLALVRQPD